MSKEKKQPGNPGPIGDPSIPRTGSMPGDATSPGLDPSSNGIGGQGDDPGDLELGTIPPPWVLPCPPDVGPGGRGHTDPTLCERYPVLHAWLTLAGLGGQQRRPGTVSVTSIPGRWKITLVDHDQGVWATLITDEGLFDALGEIDQALKHGRLDWQASRWAPKGKK